MTTAAAWDRRMDLARRILRRWGPLLACLAAIWLFFAPAILGGGLFLYRDNGRMHLPDKRFVAEALARGHLPEWNPFGGLGFPLVAGGVDAVQHPFNLLLVALPFEWGFQAWALLSFAVAVVGMFAWARQLGLGEAAAAAAALGLALGGYLVSSTDNYSYLTSLASVPCLLASAHAFLDRGGPGRAAALAATSLFAAAAGDPQSWGIVVGLLPAYALLSPSQGVRPRVRALRVGGAVLLCAAAAAPVLAPIAAWIPHSSRGAALFAVEHERYGLLPLRLLELGIPGLFRPGAAALHSTLYQAYAGNAFTPLPWVRSEYLGASVVALAALGAGRSRRAAYMLGGAVAFAWAALGTRGGFGQIARALPISSGFRYWEKVAFFAALLAVVAAAHGVDAAMRERARLRPFSLSVLTAAAAVLAAHALSRVAPGLLEALVARPRFPAESRQLAANLSGGLLHAGVVLAALGAGTLAAARGLLSSRAFGLALAGIVSLDLAIANADAYLLSPTEVPHRATPLADALRAAAPGPPRVVTPFPLDDAGSPPLQPFEWAAIHGARTLQSGWNVDLRIANFEPYTGMIPDRAMRFRLRTGTVHQVPQIGIWGFGYAVVPAADPDPGRLGFHPPHDVVAVDGEARSLLVRFPHRPRAYLAAEVRSTDRRGAMEFVLRPESVASPGTVVEGPVVATRGGGSVRVVADDPERIVLAADASSPSLLVLNDTYAPGWTATVDGAAADILPTNYLARGVWISEGRHDVEFRYRTPGLVLGWGIAVALFGALGFLALVRGGAWSPSAGIEPPSEIAVSPPAISSTGAHGIAARAAERLRPWLPALIVAASFAHALAVSWRRWGDLLVDCGRELSLPQRMLAGERIYADVHYYYGPLAPYLNALLYSLLGVRAEVLAGAGIVAAALTSLALYRLSRAFIPALGAALVASSFVYLCAFGHLFRTLNIFDFVIPYSYASVYGVVAATWSVLWLLQHVREGRSAALALSVAALAIVALTKMELLAATAAAHGVAWITAPGGRERRRQEFSLAIGLAVVGAVYALLAWRVGWALWTQNLGSQFNPYLREFNRVVLGLLDDPARNLIVSGATFAVCVLAGSALARSGAAGRNPGGAAVAIALGLAVAAVYARVVELRNAFRFLPLAALLVLAWLAVRMFRAPERRADTRGHLVLWTFALFMLLRIAFQAGPYGYGFYLLPGALPALGVLLFGYVPALAGAGQTRRLVASAAGAGLLLGASASGWSVSSAAYTRQDVVVETARGRLLMDRDSVQPRLVRLLSGFPSQTRVLTVPIGIGMTFMAGLHPMADGMSSYFPVEFFPGNEEDDVLARWRRAPPDVVVWAKKPMPEYGSRGFGVDYGLGLRDWILEEFEEQTSIDSRVILLRRKRGSETAPAASQ